MYEGFSRLYDKLTFDIDYVKASALLKKKWDQLRMTESERLSIVELGCGTGNLTKELAKLPADILAMDNAEEMLTIAWEKLEDCDNVQIVNMDIRNLDGVLAEGETDIVVALLDTMNYMTDTADFKGILQHAYDALRKGGVFSFDLNSENKLFEVLGENTYCYEVDNVFYTWESERNGDLVHFYLNFFIEEEDGRYTRIDEGQVERYYPTADVRAMLDDIGFTFLDIVDLDTGEAVTETTQRILFSARK